MRPFSNGTEYDLWTEANCGCCRKAADRNNPPARCECDIEEALVEACISDGEVGDDIARRMGAIGHKPGYIWICPECVEE